MADKQEKEIQIALSHTDLIQINSSLFNPQTENTFFWGKNQSRGLNLVIRFVEEQEGRQQSERRNAPIKTKEEEEDEETWALSARLFMYFFPQLNV